METFAVMILPIAKLGEWREFCASAENGEMADGHRTFLRRLGVTREHIRHHASPRGDMAVLIWEGVDQDRVNSLLGDVVQNPQSEHEKYIATHVIPNLHGIDPIAGPPPETQKVATIEA